MAFSIMVESSFLNAPQNQGHSFNLTVRKCRCTHCVCQTEGTKKALNGHFLTTKGRLAFNLESTKFCDEAFFQGRLPLQAKFWPSSMKKWNRQQIRFVLYNYLSMTSEICFFSQKFFQAVFSRSKFCAEFKMTIKNLQKKIFLQKNEILSKNLNFLNFQNQKRLFHISLSRCE